MIDAIAAVVGLAWGAALLYLLAKRTNPLGVGLGFYLLSLYTSDRILPRVLVDAWPNFDAGHSPALRPFVIFPDVVLIAILALWVRGISRRALALCVLLLVTTVIAFLMSLRNENIPATAALFWGTAPLRAVGIIVLVDEGVRRLGRERAWRTVLTVAAAGSAFLAVQLVAVAGAEQIASLLGYHLATVWSGFSWTRPNVPGWNNNIAASAVALGTGAALIAPRLVLNVGRWRWALLALAGLALVVAEYRTAIIVLCFSIGAWLALSAYPVIHARTRAALARVASLTVLVAATGGLLMLAAVAVPRLSDLNPVAYVVQIIEPTAAPTFEPTNSLAPQPSAGTPAISDPDSVGDVGGDTSTGSRAEILRAALKVWSRQPFVGDGLGSWEFSRPTTPTYLQKAITPHSGYAWVLADFGILGLAAFYVLPAALVLAASPTVETVILVGLALFLEVAIVGVAHSRYSVMYWALLSIAGLSARAGTPQRASDGTT